MGQCKLNQVGTLTTGAHQEKSTFTKSTLTSISVQLWIWTMHYFQYPSEGTAKADVFTPDRIQCTNMVLQRGYLNFYSYAQCNLKDLDCLGIS